MPAKPQKATSELPFSTFTRQLLVSLVPGV
jgi:hypothetical protein